jgi:hypothetical protein
MVMFVVGFEGVRFGKLEVEVEREMIVILWGVLVVLLVRRAWRIEVPILPLACFVSWWLV